MDLLKSLSFIVIITAIGWCALYLVIRKISDIFLVECLALSYGLGMGLVSLEMLIFYIFGLGFNTKSILLPWIGLGAAVSILSLRASRSEAKQSVNGKLKDCLPACKKYVADKAGFVATRAISGLLAMTKGIKSPTLLLIAALVLQIAYVFFCALIKPIESYDAVAIYAIKSKIFYMASSIPANYFSELAHHFPHPDYPLNIPLIQSFFYIFMGGLDDQLVKLIYPLFYVSILVLFYCAIRRFSSHRYSFIFVFILATIPQFSAYSVNAYLELPLGFYCLTGALLLFKWFSDTGEIRNLVLSAVLASLGGWTKNEGMMYGMVNMLMLLFFLIFDSKAQLKEKVFFFLSYAFIFFLILLPWLWVKWAASIKNSDIDFTDFSIKCLTGSLYKIKYIAYEFQKQIFGPKKWNIIWPVAMLFIIMKWRQAISGIGKYCFVYLTLAILGYAFIYMISHIEINFFLAKTWSRFLLHFLPLVVYWLAFTLKDEINI